MKLDKLKAVGIGALGLSLVASVVSAIADDKKQSAKISEAVEKAVSERMDKQG